MDTHLPRTLTAGALGAVLALSACSDSASDDSMTLSVSYPLSENHPHSQTFVEFAEEVSERTDGQVNFEHHFNAALCALPEAIECASNGTVDISFATHAYTPELALANLSSIPFASTDIQAASDAHNQLHGEDPAYAAEFGDRGVEILFHVPNSAPLVATAEPIETLSDLEGLSLRAAGSMAAAVEQLGANAVATAPAEIYESVERGVVGGLVLPLESIVDLRMHEVAPHIYDIGEYVGIYAMSGYAINQGLWEGLPEDVREVMRDVAADASATMVETHLLPFIAETCEIAVTDGASVEPIGPADQGVAWATQGREDQTSAWIASAGFDDADAKASAFFDRYAELENDPTPPTYEICGSAG